MGPTKGTGLTSSIYYAKNIAGGSTYSNGEVQPSASYPNVNVLEYSGLDTANPLDVSAAATGSGNDGEQRIGDHEGGQRVDRGGGQSELRIQVGGEWIQQPD